MRYGSRLQYGILNKTEGTVVAQLPQSTKVHFDPQQEDVWYSDEDHECPKFDAEVGERVILEYHSTPGSGLWRGRKYAADKSSGVQSGELRSGDAAADSDRTAAKGPGIPRKYFPRGD